VSAALSLVPLEVRHLDEVCAIERLCFSPPWTRPLFEAELQRPQTCFWRALEDPQAPPGSQLLAYGGFWKAVDEAHFTNIAVHPRAQRQGHGRRLLRALLDLARAQGCLSATLEVRPSNAPALRLYEGEGFTAAAIRPRYYSDDGEDALVLWLRQL
jgi:[ribosomal protein S18]-alanine N-acetyltransferase